MLEKLYNILAGFAPTKRFFYSVGENESFPETFITYQITSSNPCFYADDDAGLHSTTVEVNLFSEENHTKKLKDLICEIKKARFTVENIGAESYEAAIGYWQMPVRVAYISDADAWDI